MRDWMVVFLAVLVIAIIGGLCFWAGYDTGKIDKQEEYLSIDEYNLIVGHSGYFITSNGEKYELRYIDGEGWFLIDREWEPHIMYRLEVWLKEHTPEGHYIYEFFSEGYNHGVFTIYWSNP